MKSRTTIISMTALSTLLLTTAGVQAKPLFHSVTASQETNPRYLWQFPSVEKVQAQVTGSDDVDTTTRQMGAFIWLNLIIQDMAKSRTDPSYTPDERRLREKYSEAWQHLRSKTFADMDRVYHLQHLYLTDQGFKNALWARFFTPQFRDSYNRIKGIQPPTTTESQPGSLEDYMAEGKKYFFISEWAKAAEAYKGALALDPTVSAAHFFLAACYNSLNQYQDGVQHAKEAIRLGPANHNYHFMLGLIYASSRQYGQALAPLQESISLKAEFSESHYWLGRVYADGFKQYEKAIREFREVLRLEPEHAHAARDLGAAYYLLGKYVQALEVTTLSVRQDPSDALTQINLGRIYLNLGRKNDAMQVYKKLQTLDTQKAQQLYAEINKN